jgi:hypothetical protein
LGESFRPLIDKKFVNLSYGVAFAYVLADTFSKANKEYEKSASLPKSLITAGGN